MCVLHIKRRVKQQHVFDQDWLPRQAWLRLLSRQLLLRFQEDCAVSPFRRLMTDFPVSSLGLSARAPCQPPPLRAWLYCACLLSLLCWLPSESSGEGSLPQKLKAPSSPLLLSFIFCCSICELRIWLGHTSIARRIYIHLIQVSKCMHFFLRVVGACASSRSTSTRL